MDPEGTAGGGGGGEGLVQKVVRFVCFPSVKECFSLRCWSLVNQGSVKRGLLTRKTMRLII